MMHPLTQGRISYELNEKIKEQNYQDNDYFKTIDALSGLSQTANNIIQDKVKKYTQAKEQEGYVDEIQRVYDNGFSDDEKAQMSLDEQLEKLKNAGFSEAQLDAYRATGNPELAHIIGMKNPYAQVGAARAYATRTAQADPGKLQQALAEARRRKGSPLSESQIRSETARYNGGKLGCDLVNWI